MLDVAAVLVDKSILEDDEKMLRFAFFVAGIVLVSLNGALSYSVGVHSTSRSLEIINSGADFQSTPFVENVADLCARLAGHNPIIREENVNMPAAFPGADRSKFSIVDVEGGSELPSSVTPILQSRGDFGPTGDEIAKFLKMHGIDVQTHKVMSQDAAKLTGLLESFDHPVFVLKHDANPLSHRLLTATTVAPLTEFQISQYQIVLWTAVGVGAILVSAILAIVNMEVIPDSLLVAKFQSARTGKRD